MKALDRNEVARNLQVSHSPYKFLQVNHSTCKFLQVNHLLQETCKILQVNHLLQETCKILQVNHLLQETCKFLQVNHSVSTREVNSSTLRLHITKNKHESIEVNCNLQIQH